MKRTFNRRRQRHFPTNPKNLTELGDIPEEFKVTLGRKTFLCYDSYVDDEYDDDDDEDDDEVDRQRREKRILIFTTKSALKKLASSPVLHFDGTFETAPDIFTQILSIHGEYRNNTLPLVFALLPDKLEETYRRVLSAILKIIEDYGIRRPTPTTCVSDFEKALINAIKAAFEDAEIRLCLFHLRQSAFRKLSQLGLLVRYRDPDNDAVRKGFRQVVGTAFVPTDDVVGAFMEVRDALPASMTAFADYFEQTYVVGRRARGARRATAPRYPRKEWNQYTAALDNSPRTNNATEAWHNRFQVCSHLLP